MLGSRVVNLSYNVLNVFAVLKKNFRVVGSFKVS